MSTNTGIYKMLDADEECSKNSNKQFTLYKHDLVARLVARLIAITNFATKLHNR